MSVKSKSLSKSLLKSDSTIQTIKSDLDKEQIIYRKISRELKKEIEDILRKSEFHSEYIEIESFENKIEIHNIKRSINCKKLKEIAELLEMNYFTISFDYDRTLNRHYLKVEFCNNEEGV